MNATKLPLLGLMAGFRRFTIVEYHRLIRGGFLTEDDNIELLEGHLVKKMSRNPPHDFVLMVLQDWLYTSVPKPWRIRTQSAITLGDSEPEPDFAIVRGALDTYRTRHPEPSDIGLVIEVSDTSLEGDRADKCRIYARASLPIYWIVNIPDRIVEVYTDPSGPTEEPSYATRTDYATDLPLILDGLRIADCPLADLWPRS